MVLLSVAFLAAPSALKDVVDQCPGEVDLYEGGEKGFNSLKGS